MKYMYPSKWYIAFLLSFCVIAGQAQTFVMSNTPINSCSGFFYDPGGPNNNYTANQNITTTICPQGTSGTHVQLIFSAPQLGQGEQLCFYDGPTAAAPLLSCAADFEPGQAFVIQATAVNPSGCLTVTFTSDGQEEGAGWSADINCIASCQLILANLVSSAPAVVPADTGWIDVCPGQRVFFSGAGSYPQNGAVYNHSDLTSSFKWTFGDGGNAVGPDVSYVFEESGGYIVQLTITDQFGCKNTNFLTQRVRVSTAPTFNIGGGLDDPICVGDTLHLNAIVDSLNSDYVFSVRPNPGTFQSGGIRSDSLPLPDGTGVAFSTSIAFTDFSPGQSLNNINDLQSICVNMEHSWLHDLEVQITCPSGQSAILHNFINPPSTGGAGATFLGVPNDPDPPGNPNAIVTNWGVIVPGEGWDYCWTPNATNGTWREYATANNPGTLPEGNYNSFQPLTNLLGCPLNGEWTLTVTDRWGADNGFIFNWSITFDNDLYPRLESFTPQIVNYAWQDNPTIIYNSPDSIVAVPSSAGTASYTFVITDNFGCSYDTSLNVVVLPFTHPDCYQCVQNIAPLTDTLLCAGQSVQLDARPNPPLNNNVPFEAYPYAPFGFSNHPPSNPFNSTINVNSIRPLVLTNPSQQIVSVCINVQTDWCSDLRIFLRAPNGALLELTTNNGGSGDNYTNTCFSPTATTFIQSGTAPFTGMYRPEGMWSALNGAPINGNWTLVASDGFGINDMGRFISWSITFKSENNVTYTWSPPSGLSCVNCPNPTATPPTTTTYTVQSTDIYNCSYSDSITVEVASNIPAPQVSCSSMGNGVILFTWEAVPGQSQYEFREIINGNAGPWLGPTPSLSHSIPNLLNGDEVSLEVRVFLTPGATNCPIAVGTANCLYETCTLSAALSGSTQDVSCFGLSDGAATVSANGGVLPVRFFLDGSTTPLISGVITGLAAGPHAVVVEDSAGCQIVVDFTINQPLVLEADILQTQAISCYQGANGALNATAQGGNSGYQYSWNGGAFSSSSSIASLTAGNYVLTVRDSRGCTAQDDFTVTQPDSLMLDIATTPINCNGVSSGILQVSATGGVGTYAFQWNHTTGSQPVQSNLGPGTYCVTATDANGCTVSECRTLTEPAPLVLDSLTAAPVSCFGSNNGQATVFASGGTTPYSFRWDDMAQQINSTAVFLTAGTYAVTVTDANGCARSGSVPVSQPQPLDISFDRNNPLCAGESSGSITAIPQGGVGGYSFLWGNGQNTANIASLAEGSYSLTLTDGNGCTFEASTSLVAPEPLTLQVVQTFRSCFGLSDNQAQATAGGGISPLSFLWNTGSISEGIQDQPPGTYQITVTDANDCEISGAVELVDWNPILANIIFDTPTCNGFSDGSLGVNIVMGGAGTTASDYQFTWSNNASGPLIRNLVGDRNYGLTVTDQQGCTGVFERFLPQPVPITFSLQKTDALCFGSADGTATVFNINGDNNVFTFLWDANAGGQNTPTAIGLLAGRYSVTVTDTDGCNASGEIMVAQPTELKLSLSLVPNRCFGDEEGVASLSASGGTPGYTFQWPGNRSGQEITGLAAGVYVATVTDAQGCVKTISADIAQPEPLLADVEVVDVACHGGRNGRISISMLGGTPGYQFSLDNRNFNGANIMAGMRAGYYVIYVKDAKGCTLLTEATIKEPEPFSVDAGQNSYIISLGDTLLLTAMALNAQGPVEFVWSAPYGNTLSCTECDTTVARPTNQITYELYGIDAKGCEATDLVTIFVEKERIALVPTGFTPNQDGQNDRLLVHGRQGTKVRFFRVFDRWGELVYQGNDFQVNDLANGWDGYFKGEPAQTGVYIWYLEVEYPDGLIESYKGQTTLIR